ncbi:MAG: ATP-binding cassette domain-containing protein, partial [Armatimonadaceae bacterium]
MATPLLSVENLCTWFRSPRGIVKAVDGVSFTVDAGRTRALVGESGSGKSISALSVLQLVPEPAGFVAGGRIVYDGSDLLDRNWTQMRPLRGKSIAMIFQEPMTSLNPVFPIGWQLAEAMTVHGTDK